MCKRLTYTVLVRFIPIGLWWYCYTNTLVPEVALSVSVLALSQILCTPVSVNLTLQRMSTMHSLFESQLH